MAKTKPVTAAATSENSAAKADDPGGFKAIEDEVRNQVNSLVKAMFIEAWGAALKYMTNPGIRQQLSNAAHIAPPLTEADKKAEAKAAEIDAKAEAYRKEQEAQEYAKKILDAEKAAAATKKRQDEYLAGRISHWSNICTGCDTPEQMTQAILELKDEPGYAKGPIWDKIQEEIRARGWKWSVKEKEVYDPSQEPGEAIPF